MSLTLPPSKRSPDGQPAVDELFSADRMPAIAGQGTRPGTAVPRDGGEEGLALAKELYQGLLPLAAEFECAIAGGDTNSWSGPLVISVTAIGEVAVDRAWLRSGAQAGDVILVTGSFGGSRDHPAGSLEPVLAGLGQRSCPAERRICKTGAGTFLCRNRLSTEDGPVSRKSR